MRVLSDFYLIPIQDGINFGNINVIIPERIHAIWDLKQ